MSEGTQPQPPYQPPGQQPPQQPGYQVPQPPGQQPPPQQPGYQVPQPPGQQPPPQQPGYQVPQQPGQPGQQGYPQQPYYQPPPGSAAPPKKGGMPTWLKVVLIVGLPLLLVSGCIGGIFLLAKGPVDRTNNFLAAVQDGDFVTAYELTDPACGIAASPEALEAEFEGFTVDGYSISGVQNNNGNVTTTGTVIINGTERTATFFHEDEKICGFDFSAAGS